MNRPSFECPIGSTIGIRFDGIWTLVRVQGRDQNGWSLHHLSEDRLLPTISEKDFEHLHFEGWIIFRVGFLAGTSQEQIDRHLDGFTALSPQARATALERLSWVSEIQAFVDQGESIRSGVRLVLKRLSQEAASNRTLQCPSGATLNRHYCSYRDSGQAIQSLVNHAEHRGNYRKEFADDVYEAMNEVLRGRRERKSSESTRYLYNSQLKPRLGIRCPSLTAFRNYYNKNFSDLEKLSDKMNDKTAREKLRVYQEVPRPDEPLKIVEVDHVLLPVFVRLPDGGVARPTMTAIIDRCSKMVIGVHLTLAAASNLSFRWALAHAILKKDTSELGPGKDWPCHSIPTTIVSDAAGEFKGPQADKLKSLLRFHLEVLPGDHPEEKGSVESFFKTLTAQTFAQDAGRILKRSEKRGTRKPAADADHTLDEIRTVLLKWIVNDYHNLPHSGLQGQTPLQVWRDTFVEDPERLATKNEITEIFEAEDTCHIQKRGMYFKQSKSWYYSYRFNDLRSYDKNRRYTVKFCHLTPLYIFYWDPFDNKLHQAYCNNPPRRSTSPGSARLLTNDAGGFIDTAEELIASHAELVATGFFTPLPIYDKPKQPSPLAQRLHEPDQLPKPQPEAKQKIRLSDAPLRKRSNRRVQPGRATGLSEVEIAMRKMAFEQAQRRKQ